jgi:hypothetical protein
VRHALRELLRHCGTPDTHDMRDAWDTPNAAEPPDAPDTAGTADVAELLMSELVTNALIHTDHGAVVTATVEASTLRVEVRDFVVGLPMPRVATTGLGTNGRGLLLAQSLADAWGVRTQR